MGPKALKEQAFIFTLRKLVPSETVPSWIAPCLIFSSDRSVGEEVGGWSDDDIGDRNADGEIEERPPTSDIRLFVRFLDLEKTPVLSGSLSFGMPGKFHFQPAGSRRSPSSAPSFLSPSNGSFPIVIQRLKMNEVVFSFGTTSLTTQECGKAAPSLPPSNPSTKTFEMTLI
jgi:hypothetical protein